MSKATVLPGQNLYDIAIQYCGDMEAVYEIARMNSLSVTDVLTPGVELKIPAVYNNNVVATLARDNWKPATGNVIVDFIGIDYDIIESNLIVA